MRTFLFFLASVLGSAAFQITVALKPDTLHQYAWVVKYVWIACAAVWIVWLLTHTHTRAFLRHVCAFRPNTVGSKAIAGDVASHSKLTIHSALYGTGPTDDVSVLEKLNALVRDALVIPVNNNLVNIDPSPNKVKRITIRYSYGNPYIYSIEAQEGVTLVLPYLCDTIRPQQATPNGGALTTLPGKMDSV